MRYSYPRTNPKRVYRSIRPHTLWILPALWGNKVTAHPQKQSPNPNHDLKPNDNDVASNVLTKALDIRQAAQGEISSLNIVWPSPPFTLVYHQNAILGNLLVATRPGETGSKRWLSIAGCDNKPYVWPALSAAECARARFLDGCDLDRARYLGLHGRQAGEKTLVVARDDAMCTLVPSARVDRLLELLVAAYTKLILTQIGS